MKNIMKNIIKSRIMINKIIGNNNLKKILICIFIVIVILLIINSSLFKKNIENMNHGDNERSIRDILDSKKNTAANINQSDKALSIDNAIKDVETHRTTMVDRESQNTNDKKNQIEKLQNIPVGIETLENMKIMKGNNLLNSTRRQNGAVYETKNLKNHTKSENFNDLKNKLNKDLKRENSNNLVEGLTTRNGDRMEGDTENLNPRIESNKSVIEANEDINMKKNTVKKVQNFLKNKLN